VRGLTAAMQRTIDPEQLAELRTGVGRARERLAWERTVRDFEALVESSG
jgi:hypothetical protein